MCIWDTVDWANEMRKHVPAQGPLIQGLRESTKDELVFLHAVQAGGIPGGIQWNPMGSRNLRIQ